MCKECLVELALYNINIHRQRLIIEIDEVIDIFDTKKKFEFCIIHFSIFIIIIIWKNNLIILCIIILSFLLIIINYKTLKNKKINYK